MGRGNFMESPESSTLSHCLTLGNTSDAKSRMLFSATSKSMPPNAKCAMTALLLVTHRDTVSELAAKIGVAHRNVSGADR